MQVPVLLTRQVLVKVVPPATLVLAGMVTSATKEALLVQSGALAGWSVPTVGVTVNGVEEVAVAEASDGVVSVSIAGGSVAGMEVVATGAVVAVTVAVSTAACPLQAD